MTLALEREKDLPLIPVDINTSGTVVEDERLWIPSKIAPSADTNKTLPPINIENTLSEEEISRLHELWNGAGLSARAYRRRRRGQNHTPRRIPSPISIPEPEHVLPTLPVLSANPSITSTTPLTPETRKRWGFLSARSFTDNQEAEKKAPNALEVLRAMAQDRLKKKLRYAKSAPNLSDQAASLRRGVTFQPAVPTLVEAATKDIRGSSLRNLTSPGKLATPEAVPQQEDMDENAIYFTIDPNWRASRGVQFEAITPIPDSPTSLLGRSDSPLLHRHLSLDQLSFAALQATRTFAAMEFPEVYSRDEVLHPIDELHAYLEP
ncbi:hypothetical protein OG21DRAFT_1495021 [Imleria badia]|nr:hypothetical protein OG21DRAFT_1495021 [Imleria badia]